MSINLPDNAVTTVTEHLSGTWDRLVNPSADAVGKFFGDLLEIVGLPLHYAKNKLGIFYENKLSIYRNELTEKALSIPNEKKVMPNPSDLMMIIDSSRFSFTNDILREMFVNLIGSTMDSDLSVSAHPAFADIIKQMSTIDAMIIYSFSKKPGQPIIFIKYINTENKISYIESFHIINYNFYEIDELSAYNQDQIKISLSNLSRLGLLKLDHDHFLQENDVYNKLTKDAIKYVKSLNAENKFSKINNFDINNVQYINCLARLTDLGESFVNSCCT